VGDVRYRDGDGMSGWRPFGNVIVVDGSASRSGCSHVFGAALNPLSGAQGGPFFQPAKLLRLWRFSHDA
jgi:hypothetical protein